MISILSPSCLHLVSVPVSFLLSPGRRSCLFSSSVCGASSRSVLSLCSSNITVPGNLNLPRLQRDRVLSSVPVLLLLFFSKPLFCVCVSNQRSIVRGRTTTPACLFRVLNLTPSSWLCFLGSPYNCFLSTTHWCWLPDIIARHSLVAANLLHLADTPRVNRELLASRLLATSSADLRESSLLTSTPILFDPDASEATNEPVVLIGLPSREEDLVLDAKQATS